MPNLALTNLTRGIEIGANSYLLELNGARVVLDAGLHPREDGERALPDFAPANVAPVDAIVLTHSHQDHVGALPVLMRGHPDTPVFMTEATSIVSNVMLHNSVNVMTRRAEESGPGAVLFTHREIDTAVRRWRSVPLGRRFDLAGERLRDDEPAPISLELHDAGHILGSAGVMIRVDGRKIFYTGDVNFEDQAIMQAASFPEEPLDVLIMETTRGNSPTAPGFCRADEEERLAKSIADVMERGGCAFIPLFALGKTQEMVAMFHSFLKRGLIPEVPTYIGGLGTKLTEIHDRLARDVPRHLRDLRLLDAPWLYTLAGPGAGSTSVRGRRIYSISSGMMTEHTLSNSLARQILSDPKHALFFVGYSDPASPAGKIRAAAPGSSIRLSPDFPEQKIACEIKEFSFSGHASRESLRAYANRVRPKTIVLVHGDPAAVAWFQEVLQQDLPESRIISPPPGERVVLESDPS